MARLARERSIETYKKIMIAATKLFAEKNFDSLSMKEISEEAGVGKATLYYYAPTKEDLACLVIKTKIETIIKKLLMVADAGDPETKLKKIIKTHLEIAINNESSPGINPHIISNSTKLHRCMLSFIQEYQSIIEQIIKDGIESGCFKKVEPKALAHTILSTVIFHNILRCHDMEQDIKAKDISEIILEGVLK
jgi:AcrR family transcriptional regulator